MEIDIRRLVLDQAVADGLWRPTPRPYNVFLFGVRGDPRATDLWDDLIGAVWWDDETRGQVCLFPATTDPGLAALRDPRHAQGAARIVPGQYRRVWRLGTRASNGRTALMQVGPFRVQRDNDGSTTYDEAAPLHDAPDNALLLHEPYRDGLSVVGAASEGCQVTQRAEDARFLFELVRLQEARGCGSTVSYTLWDLRTSPRLTALFYRA